MFNFKGIKMIDFDKYAQEIYSQNKAVGWWDNPDRCIYECLQLVSTEIAEATEGERKNLMDDHLPHRKMGEVELADALIRVLDLAGRHGWLVNYNQKRIDITVKNKEFTIAAKHLIANSRLIRLMEAIRDSDFSHPGTITIAYSDFVHTLVTIAESQGYDIEQAMIEKIAYNKARVDHKRENRAKENGKKF